jgi:hypothetical protein
MTERPDRSTFWADLRRDYASLWPEIREGFRQAREQWRETTADRRQYKQFHRRMMQRATGLENPTRRDWRKASKAFIAEAREIEEAERRVLREFGEAERGD